MEPIQNSRINVEQEIGKSEDENTKEKDQTDMSPDEEDLIKRLHNLLGDRWDLISGRLPNRQAEEVERYWKTKVENIDSSRKIKIFKPVCVRAKPPLKLL